MIQLGCALQRCPIDPGRYLCTAAYSSGDPQHSPSTREDPIVRNKIEIQKLQVETHQKSTIGHFNSYKLLYNPTAMNWYKLKQR